MRQRSGNLEEIEPRVVDDTVPEDAATPEPPKALRVVMGGVAALCVATALIHVLMVFLQVAPSNPISRRFTGQIHAWIYPWFDQSWYLFAPNPQSSNVQIFARTKATSGGRPVGDWFDISAADGAEVRHNPFPSHTAQNMLQTSLDLYQEALSAGNGSSESAIIQQKYLRNIAVQRVAQHSPQAFQQIQLKVVTRLIAPPNSGDPTQTDSTQTDSTQTDSTQTDSTQTDSTQTDPDTTTLPWWNVTPNGS